MNTFFCYDEQAKQHTKRYIIFTNEANYLYHPFIYDNNTNISIVPLIASIFTPYTLACSLLLCYTITREQARSHPPACLTPSHAGFYHKGLILISPAPNLHTVPAHPYLSNLQHSSCPNVPCHKNQGLLLTRVVSGWMCYTC